MLRRINTAISLFQIPDSGWWNNSRYGEEEYNSISISDLID